MLILMIIVLDITRRDSNGFDGPTFIFSAASLGAFLAANIVWIVVSETILRSNRSGKWIFKAHMSVVVSFVI